MNAATTPDFSAVTVSLWRAARPVREPVSFVTARQRTSRRRRRVESHTVAEVGIE